MAIRFKLARHNDIPALLGLMREYYAHEHLQFRERQASVALDRLIRDADLGRVWQIFSHNQNIGYVVLAFGYSLEFGGRDAFIDELFIRESYRGRGIGKKALQFVVSEARLLGTKALHLEVDRENTAAQHLYGSLGFEDRERFFLMSKRLG